MKIYIIGSGGVGGYFGAKLALADNDVTFLARGEHYEAMKSNGLLVESIDGDFKVDAPKLINSISEINNPDLILVVVKTYDTATITQELTQVAEDKTTFITFQNGVNNDLILRNFISKGSIYPGLAYIISNINRPGVIKHVGGLKKLVIGDRNGAENPALREIEQMMLTAGINAVYSDDIVRDLWKKYIFILAFAGMTAVNRSNIGEIISNENLLQACRDCVAEAIAVAKAEEVNLPGTIFADTMKTITDTAPASKSSLLHDLEKHKRTEIAALHGTLVAIAHKHNIISPINNLIYGAITASVESY